MLLPVQMLPDREYQKSNQSLLPQPRRYSRMREELEIMKNVSLVETYYFSSTEVTRSPSPSAHCGDEFSSR